MSTPQSISAAEYLRMQHRNSLNQHDGQAFERLIEDACTWYSKQRIAAIQKTPEPFKAIRRMPKGQFLGFYQKQAQPDFKGVVRGGKSVIFEAKHTSTGMMAESVLSDTQRRLLAEYSGLGAKCFVVVSFGCKDFRRVPFEVFRDMKAIFGRKYFTAAESEQYKVDFNRYGVLDFLQGLWEGL